MASREEIDKLIEKAEKNEKLVMMLTADNSILSMVVVSIIVELSKADSTLSYKVLMPVNTLVEEVVSDLEKINPPNNEGIAAIRQSLERFHDSVS